VDQKKKKSAENFICEISFSIKTLEPSNQGKLLEETKEITILKFAFLFPAMKNNGDVCQE